MKTFFFVLLCGVLLLLTPIVPASAEESTYSVGRVEQIVEQTEIQRDSSTWYTQKVLVRDEKSGIETIATIGSPQIPVGREQLYTVGQRVVLVGQTTAENGVEHVVADQYRIPVLIGLACLFVLIVILTSWLKGVTSLIGMIGSVAILLVYMVPSILSGNNPMLVSIISAGMISALIIYLGHGFQYRSHVALFCMLVTLGFVTLLASVVVRLASLTGLGDENAMFLQLPGIESINLQGLLLGGIILAALSVLDDSIVSQVSVIHQLKLAKSEIQFSELWKRGMAVGCDHISTLVNTLVLAYAGASLPLFILITTNSIGAPLWYTLNNQMIAEEIVRTLTGSIGLVLSIPLTTLVASYVIHRRHN